MDGPAGLLDEPGLRRWTGVDGVTASGTLPVALVAVRVDEPPGAPERFGRRSAARETQAVLAAVTGGLARSYPFVTFGVHAAVTVTDRRPLPVTDVRHAVEWAAREGVPVATLAPEPARVAAGAR